MTPESPHKPHPRCIRGGDLALMSGILVLWLIVHAAFWSRLILHDLWLYNFPALFGVSKTMACAGMPDWLGTVDSGTPISIYTASFTVTNPLRLALLFLMSCLKPGVVGAIHFHEVHILLLYLSFALGMFVMGRVLFQHMLSAIYLFAAVLFAGLCMETMHSDQAVIILFWLPWIVTCVARFHQESGGPRAHRYLNFAVLFAALQALDETPHFTAFAAGLALVLYAALEPQALFAGLRLHWKRLWPAALVLALTAAHLHYLLSELGNYASSVRYSLSSHAELRLDLANLSETGFAQPTAFLGSFLPLAFTRALDSLADGFHAWYAGHLLATLSPERRFFVYQLDAVMFFVGIVPMVLTAVFLLQPGGARRRAGWGLFALVSFLAAVQQSRLYLLIFELPFFNIFRSYLLLALFGIFAVLVMSGYGMDALLTLAPGPRRRLAGRALAVTAALAGVAALMLLWLFTLPVPTTALPAARFILQEPNLRLRYSLLVDAGMLASGLGILAWAVYAAADLRRGMAIVIIVLALSQAAYQACVYRILAVPVGEAVAQFGLDEIDRTPVPQPAADDPRALTRKLCTTFGQYYLSTHDTASLRLDHEGTYFRSLGEALFQPGLERPVVEALTAIGHPIFWSSRRAAPYADDATLTRELNDHAGDISQRLDEVVYVRREDLATLGPLAEGAAKPVLAGLVRGVDMNHLSYRAEAPFYLNAAIADFRHWRIAVGGKAGRTVRGNFGGLAIAVPAGAGDIELSYVNRASQLFLATRLLMGLMGLAAVAWLTLTATCRTGPSRSGDVSGASASRG